MKRIKNFCKKNQKILIAVGALTVGVGVGVVAARYIHNKRIVDYAGKNVISWIPNNSYMNLEEVKSILDVSANHSASFAIVRDGSSPKDYACIFLDDVVRN